MTPFILMDRLEEYVAEKTRDIILPVKVGRESGEPRQRPPAVHAFQLPGKDGETKLTPYILLQYMTGKDDQRPREEPESISRVRIVVATYEEDRQKGGRDVLNVLTRLRLSFLADRIVAGQFLLQLPLELLLYDENLTPYHVGEMMTIWQMPPVRPGFPVPGWQDAAPMK